MEFTWDYRNRLTQVVEKNGAGAVLMEAQYTYDVFDRRIAKAVDADGAGPVDTSFDRFVYDGPHIALQFDGAGERTHRYLHGPAIDQVLADENATGEVLWPLADQLGTVRDLADSSGTVGNHIAYDSFGQVTAETNAAVDHLFGFTGREHDDESGLYYYRARYYEPAVGHFISEDPSGFSGGDANLTRYVENSATMMIDPTGLKGQCMPQHDPDDDDDDEWDRRKREWEKFQKDWKQYQEYLKQHGGWVRNPVVPDFSKRPEHHWTPPPPTVDLPPTVTPIDPTPLFFKPQPKTPTENRTPIDPLDGEPEWKKIVRDALRKAEEGAKQVMDALRAADRKVGEIDPDIQRHSREMDEQWWMKAIKIINSARGGHGQMPK